jgi:hypothetical protein
MQNSCPILGQKSLLGNGPSLRGLYKVGGHPIKSWYLFWAGAIGFLGSAASVLTGFGSGSLAVFAVLAISSFPLWIGLWLVKTRFFRFLLGYNLRAKKNGDVLLTKIKGECPICDGMLSLVERGHRGDQRTFVQCSRNSDHSWLFDYTIFDD